MSSAVRSAFASASPGQTVVLAPACSSFDMFRDYAERGRVFKQEVQEAARGVEHDARAMRSGTRLASNEEWTDRADEH